MKAGIVSSKTMSEHDRLDAGYYLGGDKDLEEKVERAKKRVKQSIAALREARDELRKARERHEAMVASGEVEPI